RPAGAGDLVERLGARKRRRASLRRVGSIGLVTVVLLGTVGGFALLGHAFRTSPQTPAGPAVKNGALIVSIPNGDGFQLMLLPTPQQDLDPTDGAAAAGRVAMQRLTQGSENLDLEPAVSPDGNTVAFVRNDVTDVPPSLWLISSDGSYERQLTRAPVDAESPAWSPDGTWIAFSAADEPKGRALYLIRPDGSDLSMIARDKVIGAVAWSPDGGSIVFSSRPSSGDGLADLWIVSTDGSGLHRLTSSPDVDESDPTWSPDGRTIAFVTPDGIMQMPSEGGPSEMVIPTSPNGEGRVPTSPAWSPDGAYLTFVLLGAPPLSSAIYALPTGSSDAFPLAQGVGFAWQPLPGTGSTATPSLTRADLGLGYPVCRVSSMPITIAASSGTAYVFTKKIDGKCPQAGDGTNLVGVDVTGDGNIDATSEPLTDCFSPVACEAFAAPDVNGDGTSEIAVSTAGADGYGVWLYTVTADPPTIEPVRVELPPGFKGFVPAGPLQFAWVDVVGHFGSAHCVRLNDGSTDFVIDGGDKLGSTADVSSEVFALEGSTMQALDAGKQRLPLSDLPLPGRTLCGTPLYGSASAFPNAA
ncbi:MAG: hypothetical protein M3P43_15265, partial [Actinomycetota bacterium]|nr:hypothetical protein [Actinomycetota bacterium]